MQKGLKATGSEKIIGKNKASSIFPTHSQTGMETLLEVAP